MWSSWHHPPSLNCLAVFHEEHKQKKPPSQALPAHHSARTCCRRRHVGATCRNSWLSSDTSFANRCMSDPALHFMAQVDELRVIPQARQRVLHDAAPVRGLLVVHAALDQLAIH